MSSVVLYSRSIINKIGVTAYTAEHVGYLDANKTQLEIQGTITQQDPVGMYAFRFRKGDQIRINTNMNPGTRVQLMDSNGRKVIADSGGKDQSLKDAYVKMAMGQLDLKNSNYVIKVSHDTTKVAKSATLNFDIKLSSGTTYQARYKTLAYSETILEHMQVDGTIGFSAAGNAAALLKAQQDGDTINIFDYYV